MSDELKMVSAQMSKDDIRLLDAAAKVKKGYSRADIIREGSLKYAREILTNIEVDKAALEALIAKAYLAKEPEATVAEETQQLSDKYDVKPIETEYVVEANPEMFGAPISCPCCGAKTNELGDPEVAAVKSGSDWGAWGCHVCGSNGRWYDTKPWVILQNTRAADDLPIGKEDTTASV